MSIPTQPKPTRHTQTQTRDKEVILRIRMSRELYARLTEYAERRGWRHGAGYNVSRAARVTMLRGMKEEKDG